MDLEGQERTERRLAAILAADVVGYSRLMGVDEEGTHVALKAVWREVTDPKIAEHRGRIVKTMGDGLLVEFSSVVDAVRCAVDIQREMASRKARSPAGDSIVFRIGINIGDIIIDEADIFGDGVNVAARLEALAEPGGICISRVVRDQVRDKLGFGFEDMGEQRVKNIARPVHVFRIPLDDPPGGLGCQIRQCSPAAIWVRLSCSNGRFDRGGRRDAFLFEIRAPVGRDKLLRDAAACAGFADERGRRVFR